MDCEFTFNYSVSKPSKTLNHISPHQVLSAYSVPGFDDVAVHNTDTVPGLQEPSVRESYRQCWEQVGPEPLCRLDVQFRLGVRRGGSLRDPHAPPCGQSHCIQLGFGPPVKLELVSPFRNCLASWDGRLGRGLLLFYRSLGGRLGFWPSAPGETK